MQKLVKIGRIAAELLHIFSAVCHLGFGVTS